MLEDISKSLNGMSRKSETIQKHAGAVSAMSPACPQLTAQGCISLDTPGKTKQMTAKGDLETNCSQRPKDHGNSASSSYWTEPDGSPFESLQAAASAKRIA